jgi:uncharacterized protein YecT (DUF1311 family)
MKPVLLLALVALLPAPLPAAAPITCSFQLPPPELQACSKAQAEQVRERLDGLMLALRKSSTDRNWAYLKESQILWEKSRDLACRVEASFEERALQTSARYQCEAWYNRDRMHQLRFALCPLYWRTGQCAYEKQYE